MHGQMVPYLNERFPTEIRATASAFCYHQAAIFGGLVPLVLTYFAEHFGTGLSALFVSIPLLGRKISTSSAWRTCLLASTKQRRLC